MTQNDTKMSQVNVQFRLEKRQKCPKISLHNSKKVTKNRQKITKNLQKSSFYGQRHHITDVDPFLYHLKIRGIKKAP